MNININKRSEKDLLIKNILVKNGIIENPRVIMCGRWSNKNFNKNMSKDIRPIRYFCMSWECRMCRRVLIKKMNTKHRLHNDTLISRGGKIILINLTIPQIINEIDKKFYKSFKNSIVQLKESRGWEKIKNITNGQYHFDNLEIKFIDKGYHINNYINYGILNNNVSLKLIENILIEYWRKSIRLMGYTTTAQKNVFLSWLDSENIKTITEQGIQYSYNFYKDIDVKSDTSGTIENMEQRLNNLIKQKQTKIKSIEYIKQKKIKQIGNVIKNINSIQICSKRGRIWKYNI